MLPKNVKYLSTERYLAGGASLGAYANFNLAAYTGDKLALVEKNRALLLQQYNLPNAPKWLNQTHSNICLKATSNECDGDATLTTELGVVCAILTADCLPIFAANKSGTQVGVAHAGWQGIINGVIESFVRSFATNDLLIHFGPAISSSAFVVGDEVYQQFVNKDQLLATAFVQKSDKYQLDIYQAASIILNSLGVKSITGGNECTFAQADKYFSYRRDGENSGRMAHLIWIT